MLAVEAAEKRGRTIDWTMAWVAWAEIGTDLGLMSTNEVVALAHHRLEDCSDSELPAILAIADGAGADRMLLREKLIELAAGEGCDEQTAIRKWRLLLL